MGELPGNRKTISVREAAAILGLSTQRVGFYIRRGDLRANSINGLDYVVLRSDVEKFKEERDSGQRAIRGRPGPEKLAEQQRQRDENAMQAARLQRRIVRLRAQGKI
jgi:hypothetical protein